MYSETSPVQETSVQLFPRKRHANTLVLIINDQHAASKKIDKSNGAHQKAFIIFEEIQGIFCTHSVPKFPHLTKKAFKESGNAQHFLGLNIDLDGLITLSDHLWRTHPEIRFINVPDKYKRIGKIGDISAGKFKDDDGNGVEEFLQRPFETRAGFKLSIISRTHSIKRKYSNSIRDYLHEICGQEFIAQTWRKNAKNCCEDKVKDVNVIEIRGIPPRSIARTKFCTSNITIFS
uniref:Uncharacterized protein n=1 Tax=Panagrolaimus sp. ES5 TaxID=591445 RepID=A0AC34GBM6_9BILA